MNFIWVSESVPEVTSLSYLVLIKQFIANVYDMQVKINFDMTLFGIGGSFNI